MWNFVKGAGAIAVVAMAIGSAGHAEAGQIRASSYSVQNGGVNAHITYAPASLSNFYAGTGAIALTYTAWVNGAASGAAQTAQVWCTDLYDVLYTPATYDTGVLASDRGKTGTALSTQTIGQINALISHGTSLLAQSFSNQVSSAIQLAIWSVEYGTGFSFTSDDASVAGLVRTYVANVTGATPVWTADTTKYVAQYTSPTGTSPIDQGLSYLAPVSSAVPEPASILGLLAGVAALGLVRRRAAIHAA